MDLYSAEDSRIVRAAAGAAIAVICLVIVLRLALDRSFSKVDSSLTGTFVIVEHADDILDELDRLRMDQRGFLATGDDSFSEDIVESATQILDDVDALERLPVHNPVLKRQILLLSDAVHSALDVVGQSNDLQESSGTAVALSLLNGDGDMSIRTARMDAIQVKRLVTEGALHGVLSERNQRSVLDSLF